MTQDPLAAKGSQEIVKKHPTFSEESEEKKPEQTAQQAVPSENVASLTNVHPLEIKWQHVINNYKSLNQHMLFIELCRKNKDFDFGVEKYQRLLQINPHDEIAKKHLNLLEARLKSDFYAEKSEQRKFSQKFLDFFPSALLILGVGFVGLGFSQESLSQFMGVGAALICCYMIYKVISFPD